ncbi:hypothetical protein BV898_15012 [Hypsibius exemplaris]|uniref:Uncharacterized protein n=1 Tax=Hypsibius exemplaris TaxID=2072580 RepID=A0A9X6NJE8_HYPEX|nr:hypothetical protein BV898_15012 [Hypsibius exemplaris]
MSWAYSISNSTSILQNGTNPLSANNNQTCPPITSAQWTASQLPPIAFGTAITATQLFNLLMFALWRNKEPYITLHISMAINSLMGGLANLASVPLRYAFPTTTTAFLDVFIALLVTSYINCAVIFANSAISIDR